jgi:hypothetical protein
MSIGFCMTLIRSMSIMEFSGINIRICFTINIIYVSKLEALIPLA